MLRRLGLTMLNVWLVCACDNEARNDESGANVEGSTQERPDAGSGDRDSGPAATSEDAATAATADAGSIIMVPEPDPQRPGPAGAGEQAGCWKLPAVDRVRLVPAPGKRAAVLQGRIEGSNTSAMNDFVELAQVMELPAEGEWIELRIAQPSPYRYVKYYAPSGSYGALAELELYAGDTRLSGKAFGSSGSAEGRGFAQALDGDAASLFEGPLPDDNYVGLDLAAEHMLAAPKFSPAGGSYPSALSLEIEADPGTQIFYTLDGRDPREAGIPYVSPVKLELGGTLVRALATRPCMQPSESTQQLYQVGSAAGGAQSSLHVGNSLTDTIVELFPALARSGGVTLDFNRYTIPGAGTWLYEQNPSGGFGVPNVREALRTRRFDHVSMQPFPNMPCQVKASADGADSDSGFLNQAWRDARSQNPSVQFWVYQQWPGPREYSNCLSGGGWTRGGWKPPAPKSWEEAVKNELSYQEAVRAELVRLNPDAPPPYIVPAGNALVALKRAVDAGTVSGLNDFFGQIYAANGTDIHLTKPGAYLVTLVFYACMFQKSPEGLVPEASFGVSGALATQLQRIAWETVTAYPLSGVSR
ncbi:MAG TPA: chitobiase/beta-hexosaminidase C-terminal domain-containing protein [Polyangiales bacterium]